MVVRGAAVLPMSSGPDTVLPCPVVLPGIHKGDGCFVKGSPLNSSADADELIGDAIECSQGSLSDGSGSRLPRAREPPGRPA